MTAAVSIGIATAALAGCRERKPKPLIQHAAVVRCERGASHAGSQPSLEKANALYYQACAEVHAEPGCRDAFIQASKSKVGEQLGVIVEGCKKAYCSILGADRFELCKPDFQATQAGMTRAWPPFHDAILERDAKALAPRINNALLGFYIKSQALAKAAEEKPEEVAKTDAGKATSDGGVEAATAPTGAAPAPSGAAPASAAAPSAAAAPAASN